VSFDTMCGLLAVLLFMIFLAVVGAHERRD